MTDKGKTKPENTAKEVKAEQLTQQEISEIAEIMKRATVSGNEAPRYVELINKLGRMHQALSTPEPTED